MGIVAISRTIILASTSFKKLEIPSQLMFMFFQRDWTPCIELRALGPFEIAPLLSNMPIVGFILCQTLNWRQSASFLTHSLGTIASALCLVMLDVGCTAWIQIPVEYPKVRIRLMINFPCIWLGYLQMPKTCSKMTLANVDWEPCRLLAKSINYTTHFIFPFQVTVILDVKLPAKIIVLKMHLIIGQDHYFSILDQPKVFFENILFTLRRQRSTSKIYEILISKTSKLTSCHLLFLLLQEILKKYVECRIYVEFS